MVEKIMQKDEEEKTGGGNLLFKLPKHIKQMGRGGNNPEIYIEDYAEGYLRRLAGSDYTECRAAVLVGEFIKAEGKRYVFIRGAIEAEDIMEENVPKFTSDAWAAVYEKMKRYFPQYEAVGWFLGGPEFLTEINDTVKQTHVDWFGGRDRVLYRVDPVEKEARFYLYDKGELTEWPGYCIYYERNGEMQDYLISGNPLSVDAGYKEPVLTEISKKVGRKEEEETIPEGYPEEKRMPDIQEKKEGKKEAGTGKSGGRYGSGLVAAAALFAIGALALRETRGRETGGVTTELTLSPSPVITEAGITDDIGTFLETSAKVTLTPSDIPQSGTSESALAGRFIPTEETPYIPGQDDTDSGQAGKDETIGAKGEKEREMPRDDLKPTAAPEDNGVILTDTMELYIVQSGDTLAGICRQFYGNLTRLEEIKGINQITDENWIYAGQELYLP